MWLLLTGAHLASNTYESSRCSLIGRLSLLDEWIGSRHVASALAQSEVLPSYLKVPPLRLNLFFSPLLLWQRFDFSTRWPRLWYQNDALNDMPTQCLPVERLTSGKKAPAGWRGRPHLSVPLLFWDTRPFAGRRALPPDAPHSYDNFLNICTFA